MEKSGHMQSMTRKTWPEYSDRKSNHLVELSREEWPIGEHVSRLRISYNPRRRNCQLTFGEKTISIRFYLQLSDSILVLQLNYDNFKIFLCER